VADNKKQKTETPEEKVRKSAAENVTPKEEVKLGEQKEEQKPETSVKKEEESTYLWKNTELERKLEVSPNEISIIEIVDAMVNDAFQLRTSDIHIDPEETELKVRFRIDGVLQDFVPIPKELHLKLLLASRCFPVFVLTNTKPPKTVVSKQTSTIMGKSIFVFQLPRPITARIA